MRLNHHAIIVHDMDKAVETFCDQVGWRLEFREEPGEGSRGLAFVQDPASGYRTELLLDPTLKSGSLDHISYEVDDVHAEFARLTSGGMKPVDEPFQVRLRDVADRKVHDRHSWVANLRDANDIGIQLVRYL